MCVMEIGIVQMDLMKLCAIIMPILEERNCYVPIMMDVREIQRHVPYLVSKQIAHVQLITFIVEIVEDASLTHEYVIVLLIVKMNLMNIQTFVPTQPAKIYILFFKQRVGPHWLN